MNEWPVSIEKKLVSLGFDRFSGSLFGYRNCNIIYLIMLQGGGDELIRVYTAIGSSAELGYGALKPEDIMSLPVAGAVSLNSVGSDAGNLYWTEDEIRVDPTFECQLEHCINDIAIPWFCAFSDEATLLDAIEELGSENQKEVIQSSKCALEGNDLVRLQSAPFCDHPYARYNKEVLQKEWLPIVDEALSTFDFVFDGSTGMRFYRYRADEDLYDILSLRLIGFGTRIIVDAFIWIPEFDMEDHDGVLPDDLMGISGGVLGGDDIEFYPLLRETCSLPFDKTWMDELCRRVEKVALPWFDSITTRQDLLSNLRMDLLSMLDEPLDGKTTIRSMILSLE